ncbi:MAG: hypothetical protein JWN86_2230 [Planctomycetota bacterium]|nr:hypothetical protein [Planctomycetota bacterium]
MAQQRPPRKRRTWRLRVLIAVAALAVGLYVFARLDRSAVERLGTVAARFHDLLNNAPARPGPPSATAQRFIDGVKAIAGDARVTELKPEALGYAGEWFGVAIHEKSFDDAALGRLAERNGARIGGLYLENTGVTDAGLAQLAKFPNLRGLEIRNDLAWAAGKKQAITDAGMVHLKGLIGLQSLDVSYSSVTDAGLHAIADLPELQSLYLGFTGVKGSGLGEMKSLPLLSTLSLDGCKMDAEGLKALAGASRLRSLSLNRAGFEPGTLPLLGSLPALREVDLTGCVLPDPEMAALKKSKPGLKIERR